MNAREMLLGSTSGSIPAGNDSAVTEGGGVDLDRGRRKSKIEFITRDGRSFTIPWMYEEGMESVAPDYATITLRFVRSADVVTVTLVAPEGGQLEWLHKRLKSMIVGKVVERDGLRSKYDAAKMDPNGDEFSVASMTIDVQQKA